MTPHPLPCSLPPGERVLWQGAPSWLSMARNTLHYRGLSLYFGALVAWVAIHGATRGDPLVEVAIATGRAAAAAAAPLGLAALYAWAISRSATYTITNRRVVLRMGIALPMTINLPFVKIDGVSVRMRSDGAGDIALQMAPEARTGLGWAVLWPFARPGHFKNPQPLLSSLADAEKASQILGRAIAASADAPVPVAQTSDLVDTGRRQHGAETVSA
jgi:hypothetical protein